MFCDDVISGYTLLLDMLRVYLRGGDIMYALSLKLPEGLLKASGRYARALGLSRAEYIRHAIEKMNREAEASARGTRLAKASRKVRTESMRVNAQFSAIERDPDA